MNRRSVDSYALFWLTGIAFLWWPWMLVRALVGRRAPVRRPIALLGTCGCLGASLLVAAALQAAPTRLIGAFANLSVWLTLCCLIPGWQRRDAEAVMRGVVDVALFQGVLVVVARAAYPRFSGITLPLARLLPASLRLDPNVAAFSTVRLAILDYYNKAVVRTGGIFGTPTWAGALAALAILVLLFSPGSLGPFMRSRAVRAPLLALMAGTLYLAYARVDVVALVVACGAILAMRMRRFTAPNLWLATMCLVVAAAIAVAPILPLGTWFDQLNSARQGSLVARSDIYRPTLTAALAAPTPLLGAGIKKRENGLVASLGTHSTYLGLAYRGGLLCAVTFLVFLVGMGVRGFDHDSDLAVGLVCFLCVWCITDDIDAGNLVPLVILVAYGSIWAGAERAVVRARQLTTRHRGVNGLV